MRTLKDLWHGAAVALQLAAAVMWILPDAAFGSAFRLVPPITALQSWWQMTDGAPAFGDARIILAQTTGGGGGGQGGGYTGGGGTSSTDSVSDTTPKAITSDATEKFVRQFSDAGDFCRALDPLYRIDCLRALFEKIARNLPDHW